MTSYSPDNEPPLEPTPVSADATTPRGGFMARPGLKSPPRHAVVVRGGETPESEHIPRLRSSAPPPPMSEPVPPSASERITLRAIPTPTPPAPRNETPLVPAALPLSESLPPFSRSTLSRGAPLSDAPYVTSPLEPSSEPPSQRVLGSRWAVLAAAAAGLVLGLASVAAKLSSPRAATQPPRADTLTLVTATATLAQPAAALAASAATPLRGAPPTPSAQRAETKPSRSANPSGKRSIF